MERVSRTRLTSAAAAKIDLPPPFRLVTLREVGDAFAYACAHATEDGAGTLVQVGRFDLAEFAVVLEPDEPLRLARRAFYAGMTALADALATVAPPETPIAIEWPDTVRVNLGLVGGGRLAWPKDADENETPEWLVFGAMIRIVSLAEGEAGLRPLAAALEEEGFEGEASDEIVAAFARHLMVALDSWQERGFAGVKSAYIPYLLPHPEKGVRCDIDDSGDLTIRRMGKVDVERTKLLPVLAQRSWFDPQTGGPRG
jgi:biotin-(acetyl-CoA carboxylase) ligase